jgi:hypothetical protein
LPHGRRRRKLGDKFRLIGEREGVRRRWRELARKVIVLSFGSAV